MQRLSGIIPKFKDSLHRYRFGKYILPVLIVLFLLTVGVFYTDKLQNEKTLKVVTSGKISLQKQLALVQSDFDKLRNTDQVKRNDELETTLKEIQKTYSGVIPVYESMSDLPSTSKNIPDYKKRFAMVLKYLADKNYASGAATLTSLNNDIDKEKAAALTALGGIDLANVPVNNTPPGSGFSRQQVNVNGTSYLVDVVAGNLSSTKVIVDTASDTDCGNDCPTLPLASYVSRNGAYAGVNGSYFCPAEYPSCAGKTNTFDTLAMNVKKHYFNSDNNVYSTVPAVIFGSGWVRFVGRSLDWGRDTSVDGVLANQPLLVSGGNVSFGGDGDPKKGSRGNRSFVANKGNEIYIGVVHNVTVSESALVMKAMGMDNALNLDSGGSTALWASGGYKDGPGRNLPNVILFVNK